MRDEFLRQVIQERVPVKPGTVKIGVALLLAFAVGFSSAVGFFAFSSANFTDDELAKLAELAACSTGQPASALWLKAQADEHWFLNYRTEVARQFLVDIDIDRCSVRKTANAHTGQVKVGTFPPGDSYN